MRNNRLKNMIATINKSYGNQIIDVARNVVPAPRLSTGSLAFDRGLGGGISVGQSTLFYGGEASGKTTTAYRIAGLAQKLCANCLRPVENIEYTATDEGLVIANAYCDCYKQGIFKPFKSKEDDDKSYKAALEQYEENSYQEFSVVLIDMEGAFDRNWAEKVGMNTSTVTYVRPDSAEEAIDIYENILRSADADLLILDSLAAMTPSEEISGKASDQTMALQARLMGKWNRKVNSALNAVRNDYRFFPTQIWINQEREKLGPMAGGKKTKPGGLSQNFFASTIVKMFTSKFEQDDLDADLAEDLRAKIGSKVRMGVKIEKSRGAAAKYECGYPMIVSGPDAGKIDDIKYLLAMSEKFGLLKIEGEGAKKRWFVGDQEFNRKSDAMEKINEPKTNTMMRKIVMDKLLGL